MYLNQQVFGSIMFNGIVDQFLRNTVNDNGQALINGRHIHTDTLLGYLGKSNCDQFRYRIPEGLCLVHISGAFPVPCYAPPGEFP
jgi:hypothetical protein